jgi:hypothetical protein
MNEKKCGGKKRLVLAAICLLGISCSAESFYQKYVANSTNSIAITNLGTNPMFISGVSCQYSSNVTGVVDIKLNGNLLYAVNLTSNSSFLATKQDLAGVWMKQGDIFTISGVSITNNSLILSEENR